MSTATLPATSLLTPEQAAGFLGVTAGTLNVCAQTRRYPLAYLKIGRKVMYRLADLERFCRLPRRWQITGRLTQ